MELQIEQPDREIEKKVKENWDRVAKPLDGLGEFEGLIARIGAILGTAEISIGKKAVIVMCADNGIVAEGISQSGQEIYNKGHGGSHGESGNPQYIGVQDGKKSRSRDNPSRYRGEYENGIFRCTGLQSADGYAQFPERTGDDGCGSRAGD